MASKKGQQKFYPGDLVALLNDTQFLENTLHDKNIQKRARNVRRDNSTEEESVCNLIGQRRSKKNKIEVNVEACQDSRQKILEMMNRQQQLRKERRDEFLINLSEVILQLDVDCKAMEENEKKIEHLTGAVIKCMQQAIAANKQKLKTLKDISTSFRRQCEEMESGHKGVSDKLAEELEDDIKKLQEKLIADTKRVEWENLRRTILAMDNGFQRATY